MKRLFLQKLLFAFISFWFIGGSQDMLSTSIELCNRNQKQLIGFIEMSSHYSHILQWH